ncbi:FAD-dependent monooxygenase, partial [Streptomyces beijiangensis]
MRDKPVVLIVGAGPCGLAAACALLRRGIRVRLLEAADEPMRGSRAVQLWPPALEVLDELGVLDEAVRRGRKVHATTYHLAGGTVFRVPLGAENEPLLLAQEQTGQILEDALKRLGGHVERSTRVTGISVTGPTATVEARGPDGAELIEADWLIGADGVRSTVREQLGIEFPGDPVETSFLIAEGEVEGAYEQGCVHYFLGRTGSLVFAPLRGGTVRIGAPVGRDFPLRDDAVQELLDSRGPGGLRLTGTVAISTFGSQERIATSLRAGPAFLVGDAGHTHSAVGGQGLNLGLQDVRNLVWKLAGVIDGRLDAGVLDSYDPERRQAAEQIVRNTRQFVRMFTLGPAAARVRNTAWRTVQATGLLRRWFVPLLAGARISYPDVLLGDDPSAPPARRGLPRIGTRVPARLNTPAVERSSRLSLLTLGAAGGALDRRGRALAARMPGVLAHEHRPRRRPGFVLTRPDSYVAAGGRTATELDALAWRLSGSMPAPARAPV